MTSIGPFYSILSNEYLTAWHKSIDSPAIVMAINIPITEKKVFLHYDDVNMNFFFTEAYQDE